MKAIKFTTQETADSFIEGLNLVANFGTNGGTTTIGAATEKDGLFYLNWDAIYPHLSDNGRKFADIALETMLRGNEDIMEMVEVADDFLTPPDEGI